MTELFLAIGVIAVIVIEVVSASAFDAIKKLAKHMEKCNEENDQMV